MTPERLDRVGPNERYRPILATPLLPCVAAGR